MAEERRHSASLRKRVEELEQENLALLARERTLAAASSQHASTAVSAAPPLAVS